MSYAKNIEACKAACVDKGGINTHSYCKEECERTMSKKMPSSLGKIFATLAKKDGGRRRRRRTRRKSRKKRRKSRKKRRKSRKKRKSRRRRRR